MQKDNLIQHRSNLLQLLLEPNLIDLKFKKDLNKINFRNSFLINKKLHKNEFKSIFNQLYLIHISSLNTKKEQKTKTKKTVLFTLNALNGKFFFNT